MARGKYAARATIRKETREATETIESYRHAVQRLTRERNESREKLETTERALRREIKVLRAQMESNVAPEVNVLRSELLDLKKKHEKYMKEWEEIVDKVANAGARALYAHGWGLNDAFDYVYSSAFDRAGAVIGSDKLIRKVANTPSSYRKLESLLDQKARKKRPVDDPEWVRKVLESYES